MTKEAQINTTDSSDANTDTSTETNTFDVLIEQQGLETVSEAELRGETEDDTSTDTKTDDKEKNADASTAEEGTEEKKDEKDEQKLEEEKKEVIPTGYVKLQALHEARDVIKDLRAENTKLKLQQFEAVTNKVPGKLITAEETEAFKDFQVLSKKALRQLNEDDPEAGADYMEQFTDYQDFLRRQDQQKVQEDAYARHLEESTEELQQIYTMAELEMEKAVPGLFDNREVQEDFKAFAVGVGFTEDMFYLTNPETKIILPGETEALVLGEQAADIIRLLATVKSKLSEKSDVVDTKVLEAQIRKDLEPTLRKEIEAELIAKFKKPGGKEKFQHIDEIPDSDKSNKVAGKVLSEAEFARLSDADKDEYLRGN